MTQARPAPRAADPLAQLTDAATDPTTEQVYRARCARFGAVRDRLEARVRRVSYARLVTFAAAALSFIAGVWGELPFGIPLAAVCAVAFVALVVYHDHVGKQLRRYAELWRMNDEALRRQARAWDGLPLHPAVCAPPDHPYAEDLDLFGRASVFQLLGTVTTPPGMTTLRDWLLGPAAPAVIRERQPAVAELAPLVDFRDELTLRGRLMGAAPPDPEPFLAWAEGEPWLTRQRAVLWLSRLGPALACGLLVAQFVGLVPYPLWLLAVLGNFALSQTRGGQVERLLDHVSAQASAVEAYAELFTLVGQHAWSAPALQRLQASLATETLAADRQARALSRLVRLTYLRRSQLYFPIEMLTLWSFHTLALLEGWQATAGRRVRAWLSALGEVEALAALAGLAHDNPDWAYPEIVEGAPPLLEARDLGHPLLPGSVRVVNPVRVGPPGTFLFVTGSNMSGKSTLLRAIGVNAVLAQAGGPVCASAMRVPPVTLRTSIRVQDSLERGVSYFMAELQHLKRIVDAAQRVDGGRTMLYLLDEILHGTNTAERQIAARKVILYLVAHGAIGAMSTHDLMLADSPEVAAACEAIHFTETFDGDASGPVMTFDYRIRPGVATSTNALKLMEIVGLALDDAAPACEPDHAGDSAGA